MVMTHCMSSTTAMSTKLRELLLSLVVCGVVSVICLSNDCPSSVTVSPSSRPIKVGDVLTCKSDGYPETRYKWTDSKGVDVSNGPSITVGESHSELTCTASRPIGFNTSCSASKTIVIITINEESRNPLFAPVMVMGIIMVVLLVLVIVLAIALHRLRQTRKRRPSTSAGDTNNSRILHSDSVAPVYTVPMSDQSASTGYEQLPESSNYDRRNYATLQKAVPLTGRSQPSTTDDYIAVA